MGVVCFQPSVAFINTMAKNNRPSESLSVSSNLPSKIVTGILTISAIAGRRKGVVVAPKALTNALKNGLSCTLESVLSRSRVPDRPILLAKKTIAPTTISYRYKGPFPNAFFPYTTSFHFLRPPFLYFPENTKKSENKRE